MDELTLLQTHQGFGVYERSDAALRRFLEKAGLFACRYEVYLPGESPENMDAAEWEADNLQECIDFIDSYDGN